MQNSTTKQSTFLIENKQPTVNLRKLAEFWLADLAQREKIVREVKFPKKRQEGQKGFDPRGTYGITLNILTQFYNELRKVEWLYLKAKELDLESATCEEEKKTHRACNAEAVQAYADNFAHLSFIVLKEKELTMTASGVLVRVVPDWYVVEDGLKKLIKFHFPKKRTRKHRELFRKMCEILFEAQRHNGLSLPASSILHLDVQRGNIMTGNEPNYNFAREMNKVCLQYAKIWYELTDITK